MSIPVSVIIPNYNSGILLGDAIESINSELIKSPCEIIIYDDCSTDNSFHVAQSFAKKYSNIFLQKGNVNVGAALARKKALNHATHDYIFFLDADDLVSPGALSLAYQDILTTSSDACIIDLMSIDQFGNSKILIDLSQLTFPISGRVGCQLTLIGWNFHLYGLVKREIYAKRYEDFNLKYTNADELLSRMVMNDCKLICKSSGKYFLRENLNSTSRKISKKLISNCYSYKYIRNFCSDQEFLTQPINGYLWSESVKNSWFIFRKRFFWIKENAKNEYLLTLRETLEDLYSWPYGVKDFFGTDRNIFYKIKTLLKFYFLLLYIYLI